MVTEQTAKRIADALERLERVLARLEKPPMVAQPLDLEPVGDWPGAMAYVRSGGIHHQQEPFDAEKDAVVYRFSQAPPRPMPMTCLRCIPAHALDPHNPCKSYRLDPQDTGKGGIR